MAETAQGNPLYAEQLVAMLAEADGEAELTELPPTIQALLAARLDRLEPAERDVLERAAVVGGEFWPGAIAALGEGEEALGATLLDLVRRELVEPAPSTIPGEDGFSFRHALIRDAAYGATPLRRRAAHHEQFAEWLASAGFGEEFDEIRGYHLEQAVRLRRELGADDDHVLALATEAYELLARAGRRAYARSDAPAANNLLERSLALQDGDLELRRLLAQTLWDAGEGERSLELFKAVVDDAVAAGNRAQEWYARLDAAVIERLGGTDFLEMASQAVEVFSELDDERGLSEAWRRIGRAELGRCSFAAAAAAAERALHYARRCDERVAAARAVDVVVTALYWGPEPVDSAIARCDLLLAETAGNGQLRGNVLSALTGLRALQADFDEARRLRAEATAIFGELGLQMHAAGLAEVASQVERLAGDPVAARGCSSGRKSRQHSWLRGDTRRRGPWQKPHATQLSRRTCWQASSGAARSPASKPPPETSRSRSRSRAKERTWLRSPTGSRCEPKLSSTSRPSSPRRARWRRLLVSSARRPRSMRKRVA